MRGLLTTRRVAPLDRTEEYLGLWDRLRDAVDGAGGRAWLFRSTRRQDGYIEFIESTELNALLTRPDVAERRAALGDAFGHGIQDEWEEAATP